MIIQNLPKHDRGARQLSKKNDDAPGPEGPEDGYRPSNKLMAFYHDHQDIVNVGGGAMLGAGIARLAGVPSEAIMSAAGVGAVAGYFADDSGPWMAAGAGVGAGIAAFAGMPGAAVVGAAGTGALVAYFFT